MPLEYSTIKKICVMALGYLALFFLPLNYDVEASVSVRLMVDVNPKKITIGDPIEYALSVTYSSTVYSAPFNVPAMLNEFEVLHISTGIPEKVDNKLRVAHHLRLTTFSTGTQTIPSLSLQFAVPSTSTDSIQMAEAKTEPIDIVVRSLLEEKGDRGGLMPPKGFFSFRSWRWLWMVMVAVVILSAIFFWFFRRKKQMLLERPGEPPRPPEEKIWDVLQRLEDSDWISKGLIKEYYSDLSVALRQYLEDRFQIDALEKTTSELMSECRKKEFPVEHNQILREFFENGDLVKFAKFIPSEQDIIEDMNRVKKFVTLTTPEKPAQVHTPEQIPV